MPFKKGRMLNHDSVCFMAVVSGAVLYRLWNDSVLLSIAFHHPVFKSSHWATVFRAHCLLWGNRPNLEHFHARAVSRWPISASYSFNPDRRQCPFGPEPHNHRTFSVLGIVMNCTSAWHQKAPKTLNWMLECPEYGQCDHVQPWKSSDELYTAIKVGAKWRPWVL